MKTRFWILLGAAGILLGAAALTQAATYFVNDNSTNGNIYTTIAGNDANNGTSPSTPKLTLNNLLTSTNLLPGDVVYIDTGTYTNSVVIGTSVNGAVGNRIVFQGSTNTAVGGTIFTAANGSILDIRGNYLAFRDIRTQGGARGFDLLNSSYGLYENIEAYGSSGNPFYIGGAASGSNLVRSSMFSSLAVAAGINANGGAGNYIENCVAYTPQASAIAAIPGSVSNMMATIAIGARAFSTLGAPDAGSYNILYGTEVTHGIYETLAEFQRINTNWHDNTVADPKFVNAAANDFHLLSASGFVSNGVWVTNAAVGYSPGIDFGPME